MANGYAVIRLLCRFEVAGGVSTSTNDLGCAIPTTLMAIQAPGKPVKHAVTSGLQKSTGTMPNIRSMYRNIEWGGSGVSADEAQILGKKFGP